MRKYTLRTPLLVLALTLFTYATLCVAQNNRDLNNSLVRTQNFTSAGGGNTTNLIGTGYSNFTLSWTGGGTRTTCSIKLQDSADNSTWTDTTPVKDCTTNNVITASEDS